MLIFQQHRKCFKSISAKRPDTSFGKQSGTRHHISDEVCQMEEFTRRTRRAHAASPDRKADAVLAVCSQHLERPSPEISREEKVVFFVSCGVERRKSIYKSMKIFYH